MRESNRCLTYHDSGGDQRSRQWTVTEIDYAGYPDDGFGRITHSDSRMPVKEWCRAKQWGYQSDSIPRCLVRSDYDPDQARTDEHDEAQQEDPQAKPDIDATEPEKANLAAAEV